MWLGLHTILKRLLIKNYKVALRFFYVQYLELKKHINIPILANITEFGKTPLFGYQELGESGVDMVLYPLSAFRAMSKAAEEVFREIHNADNQQNLLKNMQTRD